MVFFTGMKPPTSHGARRLTFARTKSSSFWSVHTLHADGTGSSTPCYDDDIRGYGWLPSIQPLAMFIRPPWLDDDGLGMESGNSNKKH